MMDNAAALSVIAQALNSTDLKLCKSDHIKLEMAYKHIEAQLNGANNEHLEADSKPENVS